MNELPDSNHALPEATQPLKNTAERLTDSLLGVADAIVSAPAATAIEIEQVLHQPDALRARGADKMNQQPVTGLLDALKMRSRGDDRSR
jgi:hypothetical protein